MSGLDKVVWSEGMFLQPHHFQQQERYIENLIVERTNTFGSRNWGITELKIDEQLLMLGKFALITCRGILPDGTYFSIPGRDKAPVPIEIPVGTSNCIVYLALPCKRSGVSEISANINNAETNYRYQIETIEIADTNADSSLVAPVQVGKLALRSLLETDDIERFSGLGLARIVEARGDHQIILDDQYIAPCLDVHALPNFSGFVREIQGLLHYRGNMLMERLTNNGTGGVAEIADFMLLQIINRYEPLLTHFSVLKGLHPEMLYKALIQMLGELRTFTSRERRPITLPEYLHEDLQMTFSPVIVELRRALSAVLEESAVAIKIDKRQRDMFVAIITDKSLIEKARFVLAVRADMPAEAIKEAFPTQSKLAPVEEIRNLVNKALPGIDINPLQVAPRQIPYHSNFTYFELNHFHPLCNELKKSAGLAIHIGGVFPGLQLELWAVKDKRHD